MLVALVIAAIFTIGSVPASAMPTAKPDKTTVRTCQEALRQANHVLAHAADLAEILNASQQANAKFFNDQNAEAWVTSQSQVTSAIGALEPQVQDAVTSYANAEAKCVKALGLQQSDVTPPTTPARTTK